MSTVSWEMPVGTEFAGYRITGLLGHGGMSIVYTAEHIRLGRLVALKVMSPALAADDAFRGRFTRESQLVATLDHPNIIAVYDAGEADGVLYIAMRLVRGDDLGTVIERNGPLSLGQALFTIEQAASALDQAHEQGLVHRDVKPANLLIESPSDRVYLTDFGVVKQTSTRGLTKTGYFLGTFEYAAPEQIEGKELDGRTDLYALGCVLYECLTGEAPFAAATEGSVIHAHLVEPAPKLTSKRPDLPAAINNVIATAMAKAKEDRYATCGDLVRALRAAALGGTTAGDRSPILSQPTFEAGPPPPTSTAEAPQPAAPPTTPAPLPVAAAAAPPPPPPRPRRTVELTGRRLATAVAALVVLVAAAVIAAVLITRGNNKTAAGTTSPSAPVTTTSGPPVAIGLRGVVPSTLMRYCKVVAPINSARQTASCTAPTNTNSFWPNTWSFSLYPSTTAAFKAYNALRTQNGIGSNFGRCDRTTWAGEGQWLHNPEPGAQPKVGGRRFCYFQGNVAVIVWLHEKLGQPSHIDMVGIANASGNDHFNLYGWYSFWHHTVGKCLAPNCVARLS
jgi:serine/threonine protein kinase